MNVQNVPALDRVNSIETTDSVVSLRELRKRLSRPQRRFVDEILEGASPRMAYKAAYPRTRGGRAAAAGIDLLQQAKVAGYLKAVCEATREAWRRAPSLVASLEEQRAFLSDVMRDPGVSMAVRIRAVNSDVRLSVQDDKRRAAEAKSEREREAAEAAEQWEREMARFRMVMKSLPSSADPVGDRLRAEAKAREEAAAAAAKAREEAEARGEAEAGDEEVEEDEEEVEEDEDRYYDYRYEDDDDRYYAYLDKPDPATIELPIGYVSTEKKTKKRAASGSKSSQPPVKGAAPGVKAAPAKPAVAAGQGAASGTGTGSLPNPFPPLDMKIRWIKKPPSQVEAAIAAGKAHQAALDDWEPPKEPKYVTVHGLYHGPQKYVKPRHTW